MHPIRYFGRRRNAGWGYSVGDRARAQLAQEVVRFWPALGGRIAPAWKREKWERIAGTRDRPLPYLVQGVEGDASPSDRKL